MEYLMATVRLRHKVHVILNVIRYRKSGLICTEGAFWKDQRGLVQKWLRELGMMKFGVKREVMQNRIVEGINVCIAELAKFSSQEIDPSHIFMNTVGNISNDFVFGITYEWDDETWKYLQHLQEEGIKLVGVSAGANFLPILR
jgi:ecdysteroid 25-hydroxylase